MSEEEYHNYKLPKLENAYNNLKSELSHLFENK